MYFLASEKQCKVMPGRFQPFVNKLEAMRLELPAMRKKLRFPEKRPSGSALPAVL
jgi:hypothetical protein